MAEIEFDDITKMYADGFEAVKRLNLDIADVELMILIGPSGSGNQPPCGWSRASRTSPRES